MKRMITSIVAIVGIVAVAVTYFLFEEKNM